jgi:hypothetical protein
MRIRAKIFMVALPLIIVTLTLAELASYYNAINDWDGVEVMHSK